MLWEERVGFTWCESTEMPIKRSIIKTHSIVFSETRDYLLTASRAARTKLDW